MEVPSSTWGPKPFKLLLCHASVWPSSLRTKVASGDLFMITAFQEAGKRKERKKYSYRKILNYEYSSIHYHKRNSPKWLRSRSRNRIISGIIRTFLYPFPIPKSFFSSPKTTTILTSTMIDWLFLFLRFYK